MSDVQQARSEPPRSTSTTKSGGDRRFLCGIWLALFLSSTCWALASPIAGVPDEPAHVIRAAAVWRGELTGRLIPQPEDLAGEVPTLGLYEVQVPREVAAVGGDWHCFAGKPEITADCVGPGEGSDRLVPAITAAGSYPLLYYVLVGWPSRMWPANTSVYAMRILSAALVASFMTLGAFALRRLVDRSLTLAATALAGTPMLYFLGGSVNPNGLEIAAGFAAWSTSLALVMSWDRDEPVDVPLAVGFVVAGAVLANTRALSPLYLLAILVAAVLVAGSRALGGLLRDRRSWIPLAGVAGGLAVAGWWVVGSSFVESTTGRSAVVGTRQAVSELLGSLDDWAAQMVAVFGWLDVGPVSAVVVAWALAAVAFVAFALCFATARESVVLALVAVALLLTPAVLQFPSARQGIVIWQGRYLLPLACGLPVLAAVLLRESNDLRRVGVRLLTGIVVLAAMGQVYSHVAAIHRNTVGVGGSWFYLGSTRWSPPLPAWLLLVLTLAIWCGWVVVTWRSSRQDATGANPGSGDAVARGT